MIMLILLIYPALLLTVRSSMGVLFGLMLLISVYSLYKTRKSDFVMHWDKFSIAFSLAMASPVLAIFLSQAYHGRFEAPYYDWASRFLLAIPIFLMLRQTSMRIINALQLGIPFGVLVGLIMLLVHPYDWGGHGNTTSVFFNRIHFSDTAVILGFLSLFSIGWGKKDFPFILLLKFGALFAGIYMSIQSGERGGWVAIPVLLLLWVALQAKKKLWLKLSVALLLVIGLFIYGYYNFSIMQNRIDLIFSDIRHFGEGNKNTSLGVRLQLYLAAIHLFIENPFFGVGPGGFAKTVSTLAMSDLLTPVGVNAAQSEVHNEILAKCAETGVFGLISILSVYMVPFYIFWSKIKSKVSASRVAAAMGLCLLLGFFIFGLSVEIFDLKMTATFFAFTLSILLAAATNKSANQDRPNSF